MIKRPRAGRRPASSRVSSRPLVSDGLARAALLAGIVGHELNNISVPLQGFNDLAQEMGELSEPLRQCLAEITIAVDRIRWLASELESFSDSDSRRDRFSIGECLPPGDAGGMRIKWTCAEATPVLVDRHHAQRAIESLVLAAARASSRPSGVTLAVSHLAPAKTNCATCGVPLVGKSKFVLVQTASARAITPEMLRDPFRSTLAVRGTRRLALAVLVHCAHQSGGHVLIEAGLGALGVAFPMA